LGETPLERALHAARTDSLSKVLAGHEVKLVLTHRGRVRLSELKQALKARREREPFGILWDVRHCDLDLQIAILDASETLPLAVAYLDMNGLKQVNDKIDHEAGDRALKSYFQAVASVLGDYGEAYRLGGDEVLILLRGQDDQGAAVVVKRAATLLMNERLFPDHPHFLLSVAAGIISCVDPSEKPARLRSLADQVQMRAKEKSRETPSLRPSVISIGGTQELIVLEYPVQTTEAGTRPD
jgi:diguanylate cyclase (GGDEF)-like protein